MRRSQFHDLKWSAVWVQWKGRGVTKATYITVPLSLVNCAYVEKWTWADGRHFVQLTLRDLYKAAAAYIHRQAVWNSRCNFFEYITGNQLCVTKTVPAAQPWVQWQLLYAVDSEPEIHLYRPTQTAPAMTFLLILIEIYY